MTPRHPRRPVPAKLFGLLLALGASAALAQEVRFFDADETVDPQEVACILGGCDAGGEQSAVPLGKSRSLKLLDDGAPTQVARADTGAVTTHGGAASRSASALALPVQFAFDSARILPAARAQLDALAEGIRMLPASRNVVIEGHTDARGSAVYNDMLSQKRAASVKQYLVAVEGIDPARLRTEGLGPSVPLPGRDPMAPQNRRVQFRGE